MMKKGTFKLLFCKILNDLRTRWQSKMYKGFQAQQVEFY